MLDLEILGEKCEMVVSFSNNGDYGDITHVCGCLCLGL